MEKAYDLKDLGKKVADQAGMVMVEEALEGMAKHVYVAFKAWLQESAALSENKVDDLVAGFISYADQYVLPQIEKIDLNSDGK